MMRQYVSKLGSYYGYLYIEENDDKYFICIDNETMYPCKEQIPKSLFDELKKWIESNSSEQNNESINNRNNKEN